MRSTSCSSGPRRASSSWARSSPASPRRCAAAQHPGNESPDDELPGDEITGDALPGAPPPGDALPVDTLSEDLRRNDTPLRESGHAPVPGELLAASTPANDAAAHPGTTAPLHAARDPDDREHACASSAGPPHVRGIFRRYHAFTTAESIT